MKDLERIKLDKEFVKEQIPLTKTLSELAKACNCGKDKVLHYIMNNDLYQYYCEQHHLKYDPTKENRKCCICKSNKEISGYNGSLYCKKHYLQIHRHGKIIERTIFDPNEIVVDRDITKIILRDKKQNIIAETIIDSEDIEKIKNYKWYLGSGGYCVTKGINRSCGIAISNIIFNDFKSKFDHISHNKMDNRKCNLRPVTNQQNAMNMSMKCTNTTGVTGVNRQRYRKIWTGRWESKIMFNGKNIWLGVYDSFNKAVDMRIMAEAVLFGEYSPNYNFGTNTVQITYTSKNDNKEYFCEYSLNGMKLSDYQKSA